MTDGTKIAVSSLVLLGAGGHAKVLAALIRSLGMRLSGVCDPGLASQSVQQWEGIPVLGGDEALDKLDPAEVGLVNGVGQLVQGENRRLLYESCRAKGFSFPALIHPAAWVAPSAVLAQGVQVMAGAMVQPSSSIGENTIVNTRASVDHDCFIGAHVHLAPGVTLCGGVVVGDEAYIGAGSTVIQSLRIGKQSLIGAGTTLRRDLPSRSKFLGHSNI